MKPAPHTSDDAACVDEIERTAFYLASGGQSLFAWLHALRGTVTDHGVLICPPLGHEQVHSHRTLRHLADLLAAQGCAVLRLDYHGTADSDGTAADPQRLAIWLANIHDAVTWLRRVAGSQHISLVGLRLGATLAALYAQEHPVDNLVLWSPIVKGRRYVRELTALSQTAQHAASTAAADIEAMGFVYSHALAGELSHIDLLSRPLHCTHALIASGTNASGDSQLLAHLSQQGLAAEQTPLPGYTEMMDEPHQTVVPEEALHTIAQWLAAKGPLTKAARHPIPAALATSMHTCSPAPVHEANHRISRTPDLFGIITAPVAPSTALPWIVMLNAGAAYRIGPGRLHVSLARQLAALGYPCLRLDINGIGDSIAADPAKENDTYAATAFRDVAIVCDYLRTLPPARPIVLLGLCSGAYVAFQSAAQLPDPAIIESILINPLVFFWKEGMTINDTTTDQLVAWREYRQAIFKWSHWKKLLTGRTRTGFTGSLKRFAGHLMPRFRRLGKTAAHTAKSAVQAGYAHPPHKNLPGDLQRIVAASRTLAMFVSDNDPGHFLLMHQARRKATQLMQQGALQCHFIQAADHTFSTEQSRQNFYHSLKDYLHRRFGSAQPQKTL